MKLCTTCNTEKPESDFYKKGSRLQHFCKKCFNKYCMERWFNIKTDAVASFGNKCNDCGNTYHQNVFEFHHIKPEEKDFDWSKTRLLSKDKRDEELSKCVMLCANCHRMRHIGAC